MKFSIVAGGGSSPPRLSNCDHCRNTVSMYDPGLNGATFSMKFSIVAGGGRLVIAAKNPEYCVFLVSMYDPGLNGALVSRLSPNGAMG